MIRLARIKRICCTCVSLIIIATATTFPARAQATATTKQLPDAPAPQGGATPLTLKGLPLRALQDQKSIWTSPLHLKAHDLRWLIPLAAATGAGIATDQHTMQSVVSHDADFNQANLNASNIMVGGILVVPAALYGVGLLQQNEHARETGLLGGEGVVDGVVVEQGMKLIFWRERPNEHNARGHFFQGAAGVDSSFPSSHSVLAWASAAVIASEYPSVWTQAGVYSLAAGVSLTRVLGQEHFPTDVLVGSAAGWLIGHYVYSAHHAHRRNAN